MKRVPLIDALCIRHDQTTYSGVLPDLTPAGITHMQEVAETVILPWITARAMNKVMTLSSPEARAAGSARIALERINLHTGFWLTEEIGSMGWRNAEGCKKALKGLAGRGYIDYENEPVFADPTLFETPSEIRSRWYQFLSDKVNEVRLVGTAQCLLLFSHYEVLRWLTHDLFGIIASEVTALKHGEHIELAVYAHTHSEKVVLRGVFRGVRKEALFNLERHTIDAL